MMTGGTPYLDAMESPKVHLSVFLSSDQRHGGTKRSVQLSREAQSRNIPVIDLGRRNKPGPAIFWQSPQSVIAILPIVLFLGIQFLSLRGMVRAFIDGAWLHATIRKGGYSSVGIELAPNRTIVLGNILVSMGTPLVAYPHNIEFMVAGLKQSYFRSQNTSFAAEMRVYRYANFVRTISDFDTAVLKALGIATAQTHHYIPPEPDKAELQEVRELRRTSRKHGILILGSVGNPPTLSGLERLLEIIRKYQGKHEFTLAGFGTEAITSSAPASVRVLGGVSKEQLRELLVEAEAILVYQPPTSGMLTRLLEATIAGVPTYVLGGYQQALSLSHQGVHVIDTIDEIPVQSWSLGERKNDQFAVHFMPSHIQLHD